MQAPTALIIPLQLVLLAPSMSLLCPEVLTVTLLSAASVPMLQAPNAPLESSKVGTKQALQLLKFAAAANCFLPVGEASGTGGLVLLPAVLPAPQGAMDYRFAGPGSQQEAYDYYFRVQRYTDALPAGGERLNRGCANAFSGGSHLAALESPGTAFARLWLLSYAPCPAAEQL